MALYSPLNLFLLIKDIFKFYKEYQNRNLKLETIFYRDPWIPEYLAGLWKLVSEILLLGLVHNQIYN